MPSYRFHIQLALEYFQARPRREQTERELVAIVARLCTAYLLDRNAEAVVQDECQLRARQRGLGRP
jgi:hypothetical protein